MGVVPVINASFSMATGAAVGCGLVRELLWDAEINAALNSGSAFYAIYLVISLPLFARLDEMPGQSPKLCKHSGKSTSPLAAS